MQSQAEDHSQRYCEVCFISFEREAPRSLQEGLEVLICSQCKVAVHRCCYDFHPSGTILDKHVSEFLCEACRVTTPKPPTCMVCYGQEGALKPLQNSQEFIHVFCGLIHNQIDVLSYYPSITFRKSIQYEQLSNICEICMKRNAHDQCAGDSCRKKVHTYCAKKSYTVLSQENEQPRSWNHHISVGNQGTGCFDISDEVLPIQMVRDEVNSYLKPLVDLPLSLPQIPSLTQKIHKDYTEELRGKRKSTKKLKRGGFSFVLCTLHEYTPYCICQSREEGEMVLCECCFQWFHQKCVNFISNQAQAEQKWICHYCKVFYQYKKKAVEEIQGGRSDWQVAKIQLPLKVSVSDLMWVMRVIDNRIRGGQGVKMLKELLKYPLKSSCMQFLIKQQNRPKLNQLAQEVIGLIVANPSELLLGLQPKRVLELDSSGRPIVLDQNVAYNVRLGKALQKLLTWGVPAEHLRTLQLELQFKAKAVSDQYEQIYELSKTEQPYQEVPILKQKATAYQYQAILSQIQNNVPIPFSTLLNTKQQLSSTQHIPPYMLETLNSKLTQVEPLVFQLTQKIRSQPENIAKILPLIKQLQNLYIEPPEIYIQLQAQKSFINQLHLYYTKIHGPSSRDLSVSQQIEQLLSWQSIKSSQELVDIVNSYSSKATSIWEDTPKLVRCFKNITLEYQIKEILKRKVVKQDKLMKLVEDIQTDNGKYSGQVTGFLEQWKPIKKKIDKCIELELENVNQYDEISQNLKDVHQCCSGLQNLGIKIEDQGKVSLLSQLKNRKEELEQLQILFTQAQLPKNPLTITKLLPSLPKTNSLVKNYLTLKKEYSSLISRYSAYLARINERLQLFKGDSKKQRKDQIKQNNEKPTLNEIREFLQLLKASSIDMDRQIKEMNRVMSNTLEIASKVRKYCEEKSNLEEVKTIQELKTRRRQVDEFRKKVLTVTQLNLKTELVELYHIEIMIRMKNAILTPNIELDKIGVLIKFAEEENLIHDNMYKTLKERFQTKNQRSKEVNQVKTVEQLLHNEANRDTTGNLIGLSNFRRGLVLSDPNSVKVTSSYIEDLVQKNKSIRTKLNNILSGKIKVEYQQVRPLYLQALKNPFSIPELSKITLQINKTWDILRRWKDLNKQYTLAHPIFSEYQLSLFSVEEIEVIRKQLKNNQEELSTLKFLVESFSEETRDQMEDILDRMENNPVVKDTEVCLSGEKHYLQYWMKLLSLSEKVKSPIPYEKLKRLALDAYNLLQRNIKRGDQYKDLNPIITQLEKYLTNVKNHFKNYPKYSPEHCLVDGFIDLEDYYLDNEDENELSESVPLFKPFEDINKFRFKSLQMIQFKREDSLKRSYSKFDEIRGESDKNINLPVPSSSSSSEEQLPQVVSDNERRKIKEIFLKNIRKNSELQKYPQYQNQVKMIENQIFGDFHNDILKYFQTSDEFQKLFIKLLNCPNISNKIMKKKFDFKFIQLLVNNLHKIDELENMVVAKNKQEETQKSIKEVVTVVEPEVKHEPIIDSIATGNVDEAAREDLKKEMKMLKESREGKEHKKKKKKDHKHRDRSKSPEAKFSSDSEKQLPNYIEAEYNKDQTKQPKKNDPFGPKAEDSPLRYDPEEEELLKKEVIHPKGSILKIKSCQADIQTRKRGRMELSIDLFTEEEHKKLLELIDPGFTKIPIRKEKSQAEMLPYIGKSRKKYRFIVGWFQAASPDQNDLLKELAEEAVEKKKVYGWQNEHIKVHMMAVKQLVTIPKFNAPGRVTSQQAAEILNDNRMVFVIQYPDRLYQLRDIYKPFEKIVCINQEYPVNIPQPAIQARPMSDYYNNYRVPSIQSFNKPAFKEPDVVYESWGDVPTVPQQPNPILQQQPQQQLGLPQRVNQVRIQFNFGNFSPINSESEDNQEGKDKEEDLAANLINAYDVGNVPANETQSRDSNQPYQGYYRGYQQQYPQQQQPQQRPPENRWVNYQMGQGQQPQNVYNPLNPMAGRYSGPTGSQGGQGQGQGQGMYNNQMMNQRNPQMQGQYYDPRYSGYKPPQ